MTTQFVPSINDVQIAYDVRGSGPGLLLVHGFSNNRSMWHDYGWVEHFQASRTVITMDIRGCGESGKTHDPADYTLHAHLTDITSVLDACGVTQCVYWGWSFGATIGTHLAASPAHLGERIKGVVIAGTYFGAIFSSERWRSDNLEIAQVAKAKREGRLDALDLPDGLRHFAETNDLDLFWARRYGVESWPAVEPADLHCPALIYTGENDGDGRIVDKLREQQPAIDAAGHTFHCFDAFDHEQLVSERATVAPVIEAFLQSVG